VAFYTEGLLAQVRNNIQHIDIRMSFTAYDDGKKKIQQFQEALRVVNQQFPQFTMKLILSCSRVYTVDVVSSNFEDAYRLKVEFPDVVHGYDMVAQEDPDHPTVYYLDVWKRVPDLEAKYNTTLNFYFHDGESERIQNLNVVDSVLLGTKRIGHGFNTFFFPYIRDELIRKDIALEVCPISNQVLEYFSDLRMHPANAFFHNGVPMVIANDDPLMFGYSGLTYDFWVVTVSWYLDLKALKKLVYNSILYSCLSESERTEAIKYLDDSWKTWIANVISQHKLNDNA